MLGTITAVRDVVPKNANSSAKGSNAKNCFEKNHIRNCPAREAECKFCGITGHFARCCRKAGKFPKKERNQNSTSSTSKESETPRKGTMHTVQAAVQVSQPETPPTEYWDKDGRLFVAQTAVQVSQPETLPTEYWDEDGRLFVAQTLHT